MILEEDFDGRAWRYARDPAGQITETIKPDGARLCYSYDKSGLIKRIETFTAKDEPEDVTRFWYDGRGLLIRAENKAALVDFNRDRNGRIIAETLNGKRISSRHDAMGHRIRREILGLGASLTDYVRDPLGAVEKLVADETDITFEPDSFGQEKARRMGGFNLLQRFDPVGQLVAQVAGPSAAHGLDASRLGWQFDRGNALKPTGAIPEHVHRVYEYDRAFAPVSIDDGLWGKRQFTYDDNGQLTGAESSTGSERFAYDSARNIAGASSSVQLSDAPSPYGKAFDQTFGSIIPAAAPSNWQRSPSGVVQMARGPKGERIQLTHDNCGRMIERRVERDGFRPQRWRYGWDVHDRLVSVSTLDGEEWYFRYDPFGRRISKVRRFTGEEKDRVRRLWPNLVGTDGRPVEIRAVESSSQVDVDDPPEVGTAYLWDGDHMVAEASLRLDGHIAWDKTTHWHFEDGTHRLLAKRQSDGEMLAVVCDHLGTPKQMFDTKGKLVWAADHHVWGAVRTARTFGALAVAQTHDREPSELQCPWRFPGQYEDAETGLYYNRYRHYDPLTGQYTSPDPIGLAGGDRPQGYVGNPNTYVDINGLSASVPPNGPTGSSMASTRPNFYVSPSGEAIQSTGYRYMRYLEDDGSVNKYVSQTIAVKEAPGSYFGFEKFSIGSAARDAFQIKGPETGSSWSDARLRGEFDTLQLYDPLTGRFNTRVPFEAGDTGIILEPYTRYYPEFGSGNVQQLKTDQMLKFNQVDILPEK